MAADCRECFAQLAQGALGADVGKIGTQQSAVAADHVTLGASRRAVEQFGSVFQISFYILIARPGAQATNIGDNLPHAVIGKAPGRHGCARNSVLDRVEYSVVAGPDIPAGGSQSRRSIACRALETVAHGAGGIV